MPPITAIREGDRVSVLTRAWGEPYAIDRHGQADWKTGRTFGTILRREGVKWVCDFGEGDYGGAHAAWSRMALVTGGETLTLSNQPTVITPDKHQHPRAGRYAFGAVLFS